MGETLRSPHMAKEFTDNWATFLDFDGTLADIVGHPEAISIAASLVEHLTCLRDRLGGALAIISGRPIAALDRFLAPYEFDAAGVHGRAPFVQSMDTCLMSWCPNQVILARRFPDGGCCRTKQSVLLRVGK